MGATYVCACVRRVCVCGRVCVVCVRACACAMHQNGRHTSGFGFGFGFRFSAYLFGVEVGVQRVHEWDDESDRLQEGSQTLTTVRPHALELALGLHLPLGSGFGSR